jgi:isopenicillin N synthase-like dioxygenase
MTTSNDDDTVPVIDMSRPDATAAAELLKAFQTIGFAALTHHGVSASTIQSGFRHSKAFFNLSTEAKLKYQYEGYESNRGYIPMGKEAHELQPDKKETYDVGNEEEEGEYRNKWPTEELGEKFLSDLLTYFDAFDALHLRIMRLLAVGMKLTDEDFFVNRCNQRHENMRLLHYPSIQAHDDSEETIVRGSVHTDFGTITLLAQDSVGGLLAQKLNGEWVNVPPIANSVVVNVGDMLQMWSNDTLRATPHQVVQLLQQGHNGVIPERYSIAFFCNANKDVMLECLEQCKSEERPARYPPINAHDYLTLRLSQTISKEVSI